MSFITDTKFELEKIKQDKISLRKFAITISVALALIGAWVFFKGSHPEKAYWLWLICGAFLLLGLFIPGSLKPIHKFWMGLALVMGWFVSRLILSALFFLVITPIAFFMKVKNKDPLNEKIDKNASSYWIKREPVEIKPERYEKLF